MSKINHNTRMRNCEVCGQLFASKRIRTGRITYCSPECKRKRDSVMSVCKGCGKDFDSCKRDDGQHPKFCSRECFETHRSTWGKKFLDLKCVNCGKSYMVRKSKLFCSKDCRQKFMEDREPITCIKCKETRRAYEFPCVMKDGKIVNTKKCTKCKSEYVGPGRTKDSVKRNNFMTLYGITKEEYEAKIIEQGGKCALCGGDFTEPDAENPKKNRSLTACVDHSHKNGHTRAIVHFNCNLGLGLFGDSIEKLRMALAYLEKYGE